MGKERNWAFTFWETDIHMWHDKWELNKYANIKYVVMGKEICPDSKKVHFQSYIIFENEVANGLKQLYNHGFGKGIKVAKKYEHATPLEGVDYCKKDNDFIEMGTPPTVQGGRSDLQRIRDIIDQGGGMETIIENCSNYQSLRTGELLLKYREKQREINTDLKVYWIYGESGSGKTKYVYDNFGAKVYRPTTFKWWEGYDRHEIVLLDDWRPEWCSFDELLKLTDIYPFKVECKGGSREVMYHTIFITSHKSPKQYFGHLSSGEYKQLDRRITKCTKITGKMILAQKSRGNTNSLPDPDLILDLT